MISVVVYGRNDEHGLRAQRRAALSLNTLAATLTHQNDEIVFVDYNSDDRGQTFVEAIADTLTEQALARLRIVRVRPAQHLYLAGGDAPPVVESIARNIGLRHTHSGNDWILSTNPDVVIATDELSLSALAGGLEAGCYGCARLELPSFIWQGLDRKDPVAAIAWIRRYGASLHLVEEVRHYLPQVGFDAPGDYQLVPRKALFEVGGFDEAMRQAWHVDANLMARLALKFGPVRAMPALRLYHCEHTVEVAPKHRAGRREDSFDEFVVNVAHPEANQGRAWGGQGLFFETLRPISGGPDKIAKVIEITIGEAATNSLAEVYGPSTFGKVSRVNRHVLPFLIDRLLHLPRDTRFHWLGQDECMQSLTNNVLRDLGFSGCVHLDVADNATVFLIDGPTPDFNQSEAQFWKGLGDIVASEAARSRAGISPRLVLALNAVHCDLETVLLRHFDVVFSPFTTRIRPALIKTPDYAEHDWLPFLKAGEAGSAEGNAQRIEVQSGREGHVFFGPNQILQPGLYRLELGVQNLEIKATDLDRDQSFVLEAVLGDIYMAQVDLAPEPTLQTTWSLEFIVPPDVVRPDSPGIEIRLWTNGVVRGRITSATIRLVRQ